MKTKLPILRNPSLKSDQRVTVIVSGAMLRVTRTGITADGIAVNTDVMQEIKAPIAKNQVLGKVTYEADGLIYSTNIVAARDVEKKPFRLYNLLAALGILITVFIISALVKNRKKKKR